MAGLTRPTQQPDLTWWFWPDMAKFLEHAVMHGATPQPIEADSKVRQVFGPTTTATFIQKMRDYYHCPFIGEVVVDEDTTFTQLYQQLSG